MLAIHQNETRPMNSMGLTHPSPSAVHIHLPLPTGALPATGHSGEPESTVDEVSDVEFSVRQLKDVVNELLTALHSAFHNESGSARERLRRAAQLLQAVDDRKAPTEIPARGGLAPWAVRKVKFHIEANLDSPIRSEELAAIARLTPCHFIRAFRTSFGDSPIGYIIRRRVEKAQGLMLSTDEPLSQIAIDCGFADQAYLCRLFRRIVGESPGAWRRARLGPPA
jgi:AraC family transcriptional regulator